MLGEGAKSELGVEFHPDKVPDAAHQGECAGREGDAEVAGVSDSEDSESELVARARSEPEAFGALYDLHYRRILNYVYRRTLDIMLAEELTSNTFFNALRSLPRYDHRGKFAAWLYRIASNEIRLNRRSQRNGRNGDPQWQEQLCRVSFAAEEAASEEDIEEKMRQFARLHEALRCLPERYQTVLALRYFEAMAYGEIAEVLGKRIGTVKSLIHRGLARLKRQLGADGATSPRSPQNPIGKGQSQ